MPSYVWSLSIILAEVSLIVSSVASVFVLHQKLGNSSADLLATLANMKPELGIAFFLLILFYNHTFSIKEKEIDPHGMLVSLINYNKSLTDPFL